MNFEDLAEVLAEKIEYEQGIIQSVDFELNMTSTKEKENRNKSLFRDKKRAESKIRAYKDILEIVLRQVDNINVGTYLAQRRHRIV